jgi:tetratricopeptide (TPR) repeat protein
VAELIKFLSGGIPGGVVLLIAVLIFANLTFSFLRKSNLVLQGRYRTKLFVLNFTVIVLYGLLWLAKKPPQPADRLIFLPTISANTQFNLTPASIALSDFFEKNTYNFSGRYLVHKWSWLRQTLGKENASQYKKWQYIAKKLNPEILVESSYNKSGKLSLKIHKKDSEEIGTFTLNKSVNEADLRALIGHLGLGIRKGTSLNLTKNKYLEANILLAEDKYDELDLLLESDSSDIAKVFKANLFIKKGLHFKYDFEKLKYVNIVNPDFEKAKRLLYPLVKLKDDIPGVAFSLGRMAIREREYESAETFLKKAYIEEPRNPRIYYLLSYLLSSRLEELEFKDRKSILLKTIELDPGYADAVYDLAELFYITGNGYEKGRGTSGALKTLENYLSLNKDDPKILSLLATLYIKTSRFEEAEATYKNLMDRFPSDSDVIYNLGVVAYSQNQYDKALKLFRQAIALDKNPDAYLYAGIASQMLGDKEAALKYYQERVRLKSSDHDEFAKEAMHGIRKILGEMTMENELKKN